MYKEHSTIYILAVLCYRPIRGGLVCQVNLCSINSKQAKDKLIMNMDCYEYKKHRCSIHIMDTSIKLQRKYGSIAAQSDSRITIREHNKLLFTKIQNQNVKLILQSKLAGSLGFTTGSVPCRKTVSLLKWLCFQAA